jgi:hypothetical protein
MGNILTSLLISKITAIEFFKLIRIKILNNARQTLTNCIIKKKFRWTIIYIKKRIYKNNEIKSNVC